jgi:hypothetical protein
MTVGPLEYIVIGFPNLVVDGSVANEIGQVVRDGTIRIVDLVALGKNEDGDVAIIELDAKDDPRYAGFAPLLTNRVGLFTAEDLATIGEGMPAGTGALVVLFEHIWAVGIKEALAAKGAVLLGRATVPPEVLEEVAAELEAAQSEALPAGA